MTKNCICMSRMSLLKYDGVMTLSQGLLDKLNAALVDRRIADGFQLLARAEKELEALQPTDPHAAAYLLCIAQWVDLGFRNVDYLNGIAARFIDVRSRPDAHLRLPIPQDGRGASGVSC